MTKYVIARVINQSIAGSVVSMACRIKTAHIKEAYLSFSVKNADKNKSIHQNSIIDRGNPLAL